LKKGCLLVLLALAVQAAASELPNAPVPQNMEKSSRKEVPPYPMQRPPRVDKTFIVAHAVLFGSVVYRNEVAHQALAHHRCTESGILKGHPSRGELYAEGFGFAAAFTAGDYMLKKLVNSLSSERKRAYLKYLPESEAAFGTVMFARSGTSWFDNGCF